MSTFFNYNLLSCWNENEYGGVSRDGRVSATVNRRDLKSSTTYTQGKDIVLKGTVLVISSMSDLQLYLINNVEDIVVCPA